MTNFYGQYIGFGQHIQAPPSDPIIHSQPALPTASKLYWHGGYNYVGGAGLGTTQNTYGGAGIDQGTQVGTDTTWCITGGSGSSVEAMKSDRTMWKWGLNSSGELGVGDTTNRSSPVQVSGSLSVQQPCGVTGAGGALTSDGKLYTWGSGTYLAEGSNRSAPAQIGTFSNYYSASTAGGYNIGIIQNTGALWMFGANWYGQLCNGGTSATNTINEDGSSRVGELLNWKYIEFGMTQWLGIKTDGTAWTAGGNIAGELAQGDTTNRSVPIQIGSATDWVTGSYCFDAWNTSGLAMINSDGELWTCGANTQGALGHGNKTTLSALTQVGSLTDWRSVEGSAANFSNFFFTKTDNSRWACGQIPYSAGGLGKSSPVQVGSGVTYYSQRDHQRSGAERDKHSIHN